jgi:hypothetical protein
MKIIKRIIKNGKLPTNNPGTGSPPMFVIKSDIRDSDIQCFGAKNAAQESEYELSHGANHIEIIRGVAAMPKCGAEP